MSDEEVVDNDNEQLALICGQSGTGKSASLMDIRNPEEWMYLGCEQKRLPFRSKFQEYKILDPYEVRDGLIHAKENPDDVGGVIIDTVTFLMDMFESQYVLGASNTQAAWGNYAQFFKTLVQQHIGALTVPTLVLAHTREDFDEAAGMMKVTVPIKGSLKNNGVEAYFSTIVATKKVSIKELEATDPDTDLLHITDEDKALGFKHVFQTRVTKKTIGERIRSPLGMFNPNQTYMDNNAQLLLDWLREYYA